MSWVQLSSPKVASAPFMKQSQFLQHCQAGTVSISFTGAECCVAFDRAKTLDATHQVSLMYACDCVCEYLVLYTQ